jgi:hypothetical protein
MVRRVSRRNYRSLRKRVRSRALRKRVRSKSVRKLRNSRRMRGGAASALGEKTDLNLVPKINDDYFIDLNNPNHFYALIETLIERTSHLKLLYTTNKAMWIRKGEPGSCLVKGQGWDAYYKKDCPFYDQYGEEVFWTDINVKGGYYRVWKYKYKDLYSSQWTKVAKPMTPSPRQPDVWKLLDIEIEIESPKGVEIVKYKSPDLAKPTLKLIYWWLDQIFVKKIKKGKLINETFYQSIQKKFKGGKLINETFYESLKKKFKGEDFHETLYTNIIKTITIPKNFEDVKTLIDKLNSGGAVEEEGDGGGEGRADEELSF